jgi:hypothetical protein
MGKHKHSPKITPAITTTQLKDNITTNVAKSSHVPFWVPTKQSAKAAFKR